MRTVQLFKENGIFTIRHHVAANRILDQNFDDEILFLGALGTFLYSAIGDYDIQVEREIAPIVASFLLAVTSKPRTLSYFGKH